MFLKAIDSHIGNSTCHLMLGLCPLQNRNVTMLWRPMPPTWQYATVFLMFLAECCRNARRP